MPALTNPDLHLRLLVGSQHLYGPEALQQVRANGVTVAEGLDGSGRLPLPLRFSGLCTTGDEVLAACRSAAADPSCAGVVVWMHTFSPAKMWLGGLQVLHKPLLHLHTQFQARLPWSTIDMDYMNLHQAAHGDREFGHGCLRVGLQREIVVGDWRSARVQAEIADWGRACIGAAVLARTRVARFGDNMRHVAVTDGDKVAAELQTGVRIDGFGIGDLVAAIAAVSANEVADIVADIEANYDLAPELNRGGAHRASLETEARVEAGLRAFLTAGGYTALTDTFEDLHGLAQLPGLAIQRLMADGYGFGAEGDWKTAALLRASKAMAQGLSGGTSFMEDYTYDFVEDGGTVLGAHMLEICPSIAAGRPRVEIHPLGIGGKADPVRAVFTGAAGPAVNASWIDVGDRFRLVLNAVQALVPPQDLPRLPVARALWRPEPDLPSAAACWIRAGGAHHTVYSQALNLRHFELLAGLLGLEALTIDASTTLASFRRDCDRRRD